MQLFSQTSRTATVVRDGDDGRQIRNPQIIGLAVTDETLQTGKQRRKAGASAQGDEVQTAIFFSANNANSNSPQLQARLMRCAESYLKGEGFETM